MTVKMTDFRKVKQDVEARFNDGDIKYYGFKYLTANIISIIVVPHNSVPEEFLFDKATGKEIV